MHLYIMNALDLQQQKKIQIDSIPIYTSGCFTEILWKQNFAICLHFDQLFVYIFRIWLQPQQQVALESGLVLLRAWRASHTQLLGSPCRLQLQIKQPTVKPFPQRKYLRVNTTSRNCYITVWKVQDFSATQFLREINFLAGFGTQKSAIFFILRASVFSNFGTFQPSKKCKNS